MRGMAMAWVEQNIGLVVIWIGSVISLAFYFGRRLADLETTDKALRDAVAELGKAVAELSKAATGVNGTRIAANESVIQLHEVRLARLEETNVAVNHRLESVDVRLGEVASSLRSVAIAVEKAGSEAASSSMRTETLNTQFWSHSWPALESRLGRLEAKIDSVVEANSRKHTGGS